MNAPALSTSCPDCGAGLEAADLVCPACRRLTHSEELKRLAREADERTAAGELAAALESWKCALVLLPARTVQHGAVEERVHAIEQRLAETARERPSARKWAGIAIVGPVLAFLLTKGKFLLLGLANAGTFSTMLASVGVFWTLFGWKFALGLVVSIYIHEMGHVAAMRRFGIPASAPMFVPGLGAFVLLRQKWLNVAQDARIGLAGPIWGLGAAIASWLAWAATREPIWAAIAAGGAWLNLLNLLPVWTLDGGRAFRALTRGQRAAALVVLVAVWWVSREGLVALLALAAGYRLFTKDCAERSDHAVLAQFAGLVISLGVLSLAAPGASPFQAP